MSQDLNKVDSAFKEWSQKIVIDILKEEKPEAISYHIPILNNYGEGPYLKELKVGVGELLFLEHISYFSFKNLDCKLIDTYIPEVRLIVGIINDHSSIPEEIFDLSFQKKRTYYPWSGKDKVYTFDDEILDLKLTLNNGNYIIYTYSKGKIIDSVVMQLVD